MMPGRLQSGSGRLEFAVVAVVIAVLAGFWLHAVNKVQADAEKMLVDVTVRQMRTGLQFKITDLIVAGRVNDIGALVGQNPVQWLPQAPDHYVGEIDAAPHGEQARTWYFDRANRQLVYVPGADTLLGAGRTHLAWRVEAGVGGRDGGIMGVRIAEIP